MLRGETGHEVEGSLAFGGLPDDGLLGRSTHRIATKSVGAAPSQWRRNPSPGYGTRAPRQQSTSCSTCLG